MKKSRLELIFEFEDDIRRREHELVILRWEHQQLLQLLEKDPQALETHGWSWVRLWYRLKRLLARLSPRLLTR